MITIDLSKQQSLDTDPEAIQEINFTANLDQQGNTKMFYIIEDVKKTVSDSSQGIVKVLWMLSYDLNTAFSRILFSCNIISK